MRMVYSDPSLVRCEFFRSILEGKGIRCMIRNDLSSLTAGHGFVGPSGPALPFAVPQIWVLDDDKAEEAATILRDISSSQGDQEPE